MIKKLQNNQIEIAEKIRTVFLASYKVEAELLKATDFPPLKRPLEKYINTNTIFFGYFLDGNLAGVVEIIADKDFTHIRSLVVSPSYFRKGIGSSLVEFTLNNFDTNLFIVETGVDNAPASELYKKFGFIEVNQWDTDHGVRKIKFELRIF